MTPCSKSGFESMIPLFSSLEALRNQRLAHCSRLGADKWTSRGPCLAGMPLAFAFAHSHKGLVLHRRVSSAPTAVLLVALRAFACRPRAKDCSPVPTPTGPVRTSCSWGACRRTRPLRNCVSISRWVARKRECPGRRRSVAVAICGPSKNRLQMT